VNDLPKDFLVKIIPPRGNAVYRLKFTKGHLVAAAAGVMLALLTAVGYHTYRLHVTEGDLRALQELTVRQQSELQTIDRQADGLAAQLRAVQQQNAEIKRMIGGGAKTPLRGSNSADVPRGRVGFRAVHARLHALAAASLAANDDAQHLQRLAMRVLNVRRMAAIARTRMLAAIPSLNPVGGGIAAGFGWRSNPWPEFHKGVDLAADWGTVVHATAAGTVASAGWDGGFGIKVDIDHGNGYHTWYAHLSRVMVHPGEAVAKGTPIAQSGATGEATGPHLHYQLMYQGRAIDPAPFLNGVPASVMATLPGAPGV
jgi:murein DD-endopeptidase MepM/ murein hydrolase activator NlpD